MKTALITGSSGLVGSEAVHFLCNKGFRVIGLDNDMRRHFFGPGASTQGKGRELAEQYPAQFVPHSVDIRDPEALTRIFSTYNADIELIIHAAAQPSHDWAARDPRTDFTVNAGGTLEMLEHTRQYCPRAVFIHCSTNKVYGDTPNRLPLIELDTRWELDRDHPYYEGIDEQMSIDQSMHSLFGVSKTAADLLAQEYGRYFGLNTGIFRGGCLTGPRHAGAQLHGFLSYLMKCAMTGTPYTVLGYQGKQVRDNIHSHDLIEAFYAFYQNPRQGAVYNIGGGRFSNCSMLEAIDLCEAITGQELNWSYQDENRMGDHQWWISSLAKFRRHFPDWKPAYSVEAILREIHDENQDRWVWSSQAAQTEKV